MVGTAKLTGIVPVGSNFTPRGLSQQGNTQEVDGAWPNLPPRPGESGRYAPTWSLGLAPKGSVRPDPQLPGRYLATCLFKIDEQGFFEDTNAEVEYWLDRVADLEIDGLPADRYRDLDPDALILSSLEIRGIESGEPYAVVFDVEYRIEGEGPMALRASLVGMIARSTFKGGRGRLEVQRALAALRAA